MGKEEFIKLVWTIGGKIILLLIASLVITSSIEAAQLCIEDVATGEVVCGPDESPISPLIHTQFIYLPEVAK